MTSRTATARIPWMSGRNENLGAGGAAGASADVGGGADEEVVADPARDRGRVAPVAAPGDAAADDPVDRRSGSGGGLAAAAVAAAVGSRSCPAGGTTWQ